MTAPLRILIVEDSVYDVDLLRRTLRRGGYEVTSAVVDTPEAMRTALAQQDWDIITSDHAMPWFSAPRALALAKEVRPDLPFIIVSGEINLNLAVSLMRDGAEDYIPKGEWARLVPAIERALRDVEVRRARQQVEDALQVSEMRYRRLFEAARDGILILDVGTHQITDVNPFMVELLGYTRDEYLGKELWEIGVLTDAEASREAFRTLQATGYIRYEHLPLQSKHGVRRDVEFVSNVYQEDSHPVIQCNIRDISARTQADARSTGSMPTWNNVCGTARSNSMPSTTIWRRSMPRSRMTCRRPCGRSAASWRPCGPTMPSSSRPTACSSSAPSRRRRSACRCSSTRSWR